MQHSEAETDWDLDGEFEAIGVLAQEMTESYRDAAELAHDPELAKLFEQLADGRAALERAIAQELRRHDELPRDRDPDRAAIKQLFRHAKRSLSSEGDVVLIRELERDEDRLAAKLARTLEHAELTEHACSILRAHRERVMQAQARLAEHRMEQTAQP